MMRLLSLALASCLFVSTAAWTVPAPAFTGDGTFYSLGDQAGTCAFESVTPVGIASFKQLPFATGIDTFVALNSQQYANVSSCGQCLVYQGTGSGSGTTPVAQTPQYAMITNLCPECKTGDLDLDRPGDGRWRISWTPVECAVGLSTFQFAFEGSNSYYLKIKILNARVPTASMAAEVHGVYQSMTPTQDNAFTLSDGGPFQFPLKLQLTSIQGDMVDDTLSAGPPSTVQGTAQYPPTSGLANVNTASATGASVQDATPGQVQTCNVSLEAYSQCGGQSLDGLGDEVIPGSCCPYGFSCVRQNAWYYQCLEINQPTVAPGSGVEAPMTAPAAQEAPSLPPVPGSPFVVCSLVQELLNVPSLAASCAWKTQLHEAVIV